MTNLEVKLWMLNSGVVLIIYIIMYTIFFSFPTTVSILVMGAILSTLEYIKWRIYGVNGWLFKQKVEEKK